VCFNFLVKTGPDSLLQGGGDFLFKMENNSQKNWWQAPLVMFVNLSVWIVIPVLLGSLLGKWLDGKYSTKPFLFLVCVGVAFLVSMGGLIYNAMKEFKKIEIEEQDKNTNIKKQDTNL
jgi:F0F1-type ATP synthase assembly protein I